MRWKKTWICALGASLLISSTSYAGSGEDKAAADTLFKAGRALVKQGKFAEACPKLEASQKLDPAPGTLLALADCYESNGQTASAWTTFNDARAMARKANDAKRAEEAERRAGLLEPKLSKIIIEVPQDTRVSGAEVRRNGKLVETAMFGLEVPIDPGKQTIDATAPGQQVWTTEVLVEAKPGVTTIRIPSLVDMKPAVTDYVPPPPPQKQPPARANPADEPSAPGMSTQRKVGLVLGGVGLASIAVGALGFGPLAINKGEEVRAKCTEINPDSFACPNQALVDEYHTAGTYAQLANVTIGVGAGALVAGIIVFAVAPKSSAKTTASWKVTPIITPGSTSLSFTGAF